MLNDPFHETVAQIALRASQRHGFALGGGQALIAHGLVSRNTEDIDLFTDEDHAVQIGATAVEEALRTAGYESTRLPEVEGLGELFEGFDDGMVELEVTDEQHLVRLTLARLDRQLSPVILDVGPVMHADDCIASKVGAAVSRGEVRDFVDLAAATDQYTIQEMIQLATRLDPGLSPDEFAAAGRRLDTLSKQRFELYGLPAESIATVREKLAGWPRPG